MKLKPCPFCGQEPKMIKISETGYRIECANLACGVIVKTSIAGVFARANAAAAEHIIEKVWNTRAESKAEPSTSAPDNVNHPSHYETNGVECIVAMEAAQGADAVQDFCICNAFKYIWRHKHKNGAEDIKKAVWYLNKWLELEGRDNTGNERF